MSDTVPRIKKVLSESLGLDAESEIDTDAPLMGGEHDLDSLDMLLVVTGLEKEFGVKIDSEELSQADFSNVQGMARFIDGLRADG